MESSKYPWPSNVNVANFVTVRNLVVGDEDERFSMWKKQMMCLLKSQDVAGFVTGEIPPPEKDGSEQHEAWTRTDCLVKGWILGSINEDVLGLVWEKETAMDIWDKLEDLFSPKKDRGNICPNDNAHESSRMLELYKAAREGDLSRFHKDGDFEAILNGYLETALHVAVMSEKANEFVSEAVRRMPREKLGHEDAYGNTALHCAAAAGNAVAVEALLKKNPDLAYRLNREKQLPVLKAAITGQQEPLRRLIRASKDSERDVKPFEGRLGLNLLCEVIRSELFDVALELVKEYPDLAGIRFNYDNDEDEEKGKEEEKEKDGSCNAVIFSALSTIAEMPSAFRSREEEDFNWWQDFIYRCLLLTKSKRKDAFDKCLFGDVERGSGHAPATNSYCRHWLTFQGGKYIIESVTSILKFQFRCTVECLIWKAIVCVVPEVEKMMKRIEVHRGAEALVSNLCEEMVKMPEKRVRCMFLDSILLAAENGISEIVKKIKEVYPSIVFAVDHNGRHVFQLAAKNRYEKVFKLLHGLSGLKSELFDVPDNKGNNLMHICGKLAPSHRLNLVSGAALQMQRELQWFEEMKNCVRTSRQTKKNNKGLTPQMIFTKNHKHLKEAGEKWMKETASACNIAATLIATVMFAAAFTLPDKKVSKFAFNLFGISDAIALFTSVTSVLVFVSILTSRYAEKDFLHSLPRRLALGLTCLFVSIIFMLIAFCATMYIIFREELAWVLIPMLGFACLPVTLFVLLQLPLLGHVIHSTYLHDIFGKKKRVCLLHRKSKTQNK